MTIPKSIIQFKAFSTDQNQEKKMIENRTEVISAFHILEHVREIINSNFRENWAGILTTHFGKTDVFWGKLSTNKDGHYYYAMNTKGGMIIATDSRSPYFTQQSKAKVADEPVDKISITTLQTWSDNLSLMTPQLIKEILKEEKITCPPDGLKIDTNDSKGYEAAILGTPNGKGIGWLLAQHKNQLGNPKILGFCNCYLDTGELVGERGNVRGDDDTSEHLNLNFTIRCE
ncbi:uncharacterized protein EAF01_006294 [Botrytis porri]|uniref:uncharacterized protein n=1 Tax=Botrytis porri TaxID=87229 RepID=UPI0018FF1284|nr:uncharacterized protein EAF01_006294 [Botrytis porri]KAF7903245.1 hypothetical protein EAF01_006294 [Botrytis porri]